ncbi:MAG TPA: hypothetical protein VLG16_00555 [Candidatus Saccharimonadales bacterium]|nr:hypothetical protein [Candidatus Saccharimonadales bacterium]
MSEAIIATITGISFNKPIANFEEETILAVGHGVFGRAMARHYNEQPYTEEFDRAARQATNLANGEVMQLYPSPVEILQP